MPSLKKVVTSGSNAELANLTASAFQLGTDVVTLGGDLTTQNNGLTINAADADRTLTLTEDLTIGGGSAGTITFSAGSKTLTIEDTTAVNQDVTTDGNPTFANLTLTGNLTVNGDTTTLSTTNLVIKDAFGFFATGSAASNVDAGLVVQSGSYVDSGSALYHDIDSGRWSVAKSVGTSVTTITPLHAGQESVVTTRLHGGNPALDNVLPEYGAGEMFVETGSGEIFIYS